MPILDLAQFMAELRQAQADIAELKIQPHQLAFDPSLIISDEDEDILDLIGMPLKDKGKQVDESVDMKATK